MHMTTADFAAAHLEFLARCGRVTHVVSALAGRLSLSLQAEISEIVGQSVALGDGRMAISVGKDIPSELSVLPVKVSRVDLGTYASTEFDGAPAGDLVLAQLTAIKHRLTQMDRLHDRMDGLEHALADRIAATAAPFDEDDPAGGDEHVDGPGDRRVDGPMAEHLDAPVMDQRPALPVGPGGSMQSPAPSIDPEKLDMASRESEMLEAVAALLQEKRIVSAPAEDAPVLDVRAK